MEEKKKNSGIMPVVFAAVAAGFLGVLAGGVFPENNTQTNYTSAQTAAEPEPNPEYAVQAEANPEYERIFRERAIVHMPALFANLDSASFAKVMEDGTIDNVQFGYKNDLISTLIQTRFMSISHLSDSEKAEADAVIKETYAVYDNVDFASIDTQVGSNYYRISLRIEGLDTEDTLRKAEESGLIETNGQGLMSMSVTEQDLLAEGYVKE